MSDNKRLEWFENARFGMFIHWGIYAIPAKSEWIKSLNKMTDVEYKEYFEQFAPDRFDPVQWAKAAKNAGMKYAVLTSKHHDGFCLFDSKLTDYKSTNTPFGRDIVEEYVQAFRNEGIRVGLYYSLLDWHHPDYPHFGDRIHPMRENEKYRDYKHDFNKYLEYMHGQIYELCSNYGKIDILWFDFSYDQMKGEKWRSKELLEKVRSLQPEIIFNNRLEGSGEEFGSLMKSKPSEYAGDFVSPEQLIPPEGMKNDSGEPVMWESCITMNNNWGYNSFDKEFKSSDTIIRKLVECVSKNGNLLLNVGPDARGKIPDQSLKILEKIGKWMDENSRSIYGCGYSGISKPEFGRYTGNGKNIYVHVMEPTIGPVPLVGIPKNKIKRMSFLSSGAQMNFANTWATANYPDIAFVNFGPEKLGSYKLPDSSDTVIKVEMS